MVHKMLIVALWWLTVLLCADEVVHNAALDNAASSVHDGGAQCSIDGVSVSAGLSVIQ